MLLAGTAAALESISQPIATSGYLYAIRADGALHSLGRQLPRRGEPHGWPGPARGRANVLLGELPLIWTRGLSRPPPLTRMGPSGAGAATRARTFGEEEPYRLLEDVVSVSVGETDLNVLPCALTGRCGPGAPGPECPWRNIRMIPTIRPPRYWTRWFSCLGIWR